MDLFNDNVIDYIGQSLTELKYDIHEAYDISVKLKNDIQTIKDEFVKIRGIINDILLNEIPKLDY